MHLTFLACTNGMTKTFLSMLIIASYVILEGCGTTGPLYIPEQRYPQGKGTQDEAPKAPAPAPTDSTTYE